jgi:hypothetical protein
MGEQLLLPVTACLEPRSLSPVMFPQLECTVKGSNKTKLLGVWQHVILSVA